MSEKAPTSQFVIDLLTTLRQERFSPSAWWRFLARSWALSLTTARTNPQLKRSWLQFTLFIGILSVLLLFTVGIAEGIKAALSLLPAFTMCVAWQQSDLFWHLGLNYHPKTGKLFQQIGLANMLTALRGLCASFLLGRLIGGLNTPTFLALSVFSIGILTDILDGLIARGTGTQSRLGQILDGETDFVLYSTISLILLQHAVLAPWLALAMVLRFCIPLVAALVSYFLLARPVRFGSTLWGKAAGVIQCLYILSLLAPTVITNLLQPLQSPLLISMLLLSMIAPTAQILLQKKPG